MNTCAAAVLPVLKAALQWDVAVGLPLTPLVPRRAAETNVLEPAPALKEPGSLLQRNVHRCAASYNSPTNLFFGMFWD